jgi:hypothetical protein
MLRVNHTTNSNASRASRWLRLAAFCLNDWRFSAYSLLLLAIFLIIMSTRGHGDDLTGQPVDDPKDLFPTPATSSQPACESGLFVPMPTWARSIIMPPLPAELKPMGGKTAVASPPPPPAPLAPPRETTVTTTASSTPTPANSTEKSSSSAAENNPSLIAVSPFLQWIKTNPQAAAVQARQQAESYHAGPPAEGGAPGEAVSAGHSPTSAPGGSGDPYWLPPLIDSADFGPTAVGGSAAIYSTPQR